MSAPGFKLTYHPSVVNQDIPELDRPVAIQIKKAIEVKLATSPEIYGSPLRGTLKGYWKLRVGDWRVVYDVKGATVRIWVIAHRREVYDLAKKRL
ncbi:MAG: type II toxin-antitoxin system RelE/ParE family toxin [Patescibacteria group bacterium]